MTRIVGLSQTEIEQETGIKDAFRTPIGSIARIEMDKETKRRKEILRRHNNLERRVDKDWRMQNAINEKATEAMATLLDMYAKYGHSTSERVQ